MPLKEVIILSKTQNFRRFWNVIKLYSGFWISRIVRKPIILGEPFAISLEPTTICDLKCPECPTGLGILKRPRGTLSDETFQKFENSLSPNTFYINLYLQGEPLLHPKITHFTKRLSTKKLFTVISTNAQLINEKVAENIVLSGLSKIIIGLDGLTQESYSTYRKSGSVDKVFRAIELLKNARIKQKSKTPIISLQFIVFKHNQHEITQALQLKNSGVDEVLLKTPQFISNGQSKIKPSTKKKLTRYVPNFGNLILKRKSFNHCWKVWSSMVFSWNGQMFPCCFDKDGEYVIGDINSNSTSFIWNSKEFNSLRKTILEKKDSISMCTNCTEGRKWWI